MRVCRPSRKRRWRAETHVRSPLIWPHGCILDDDKTAGACDVDRAAIETAIHDLHALDSVTPEKGEKRVPGEWSPVRETEA